MTTSGAVIILSARGDEEERLVGLEVGADDYVVKPVSPREAVLRVQALLRRSERLGAGSMLPRTVAVGDLFVDPARVNPTPMLRSSNHPLTPREGRPVRPCGVGWALVLVSEELVSQ